MSPDDVPGGAVDPFLIYPFRLRWDDRTVAGFTTVSGLTRPTQVIAHRTGEQPSTIRRIPGQTEYAPVVLERGVTDDVAFAQWANMKWYYRDTGQLDDEVSLADFRKDVQLEVYDEARDLALRFTIARCWPSSYTDLPELDASGMVAIAALTLEHEGWTREDVTPPASP